MNEVIETLSFEGEVFVQQKNNEIYKTCTQIKYQTEANKQEHLLKVEKNGNFKIRIISKGTNVETSEKIYKFYLDGHLMETSFFSPKKILEIVGKENLSKLKQKTPQNLKDLKEISTIFFCFYCEKIQINGAS
jgi:hypothetical protein